MDTENIIHRARAPGMNSRADRENLKCEIIDLFVVNRKELKDREVLIVGDESKVVILVDPETDEMEVVHPNDDGSYWRKYQRNKRIRQEEKAREMAAKLCECKRADAVQ
jgi:hypothetical protein